MRTPGFCSTVQKNPICLVVKPCEMCIATAILGKQSIFTTVSVCAGYPSSIKLKNIFLILHHYVVLTWHIKQTSLKTSKDTSYTLY